jgi:uncharacterized protein (UPF0332 family)
MCPSIVNPLEQDALVNLEGVSARRVELLRSILRARPGLDQPGLEALLDRFARDRFCLGVDFAKAARRITGKDRGDQITVLSRSYYAMYQGARAVVFAAQRSDVEEHREVREDLPDDLRDRQKWANSLDRWRKRRNQYDYRAYPKEAHLLAQESIQAAEEAGDFLEACREYLIKRGVEELPDV